MVNVIGVRFQNAGKLYYFDPGSLWPTPGDFVIVETSRGVEFGEVVTEVREINEEELTSPLKQVIRIATAQDVQHAEDNKKSEKEAYAICQKKIGDHKLDMKLVSVEYTFDNSKILFYFTANGRVDFRSLVKDLASVFKTRIELRQIGVRDEARMLGGLGPCGRPICCGAFLGVIEAVSIKMAKEQNLSLNPTKISGVCGRLMCCLKYEQENYEQTRKKMPKVGKEVMTPDGPGVVWDLNIIKESVRVRIQKGDNSELKDFPMEEVQRIGGPQNHSGTKPAEADKPAPAAEDVQSEETVVPETADEQAAPEAGEQKRERRPRPQRERPAKDKQRQERQRPDKQQQGERKPAQPAEEQNQKAAEEPAKAPEQKQQPRQEEAKPAEAKPAVSPWKMAVEQALRAAREESDQNN